MKKLFALIIAIVLAHLCLAQSFDEWFQQKKTQRKYLIQQIAALQVYLDYMKKGYGIAKDELDMIQNLRDGEFVLHDSFFTSLKTVNPVVKNAAEVTEIVALQLAIVNRFKNTIVTYKKSLQFNSDELSYITRVYTAFTSDCLKDIDALMLVISSNALQMTDDERMKQINAIYHDMQDKNSFAQYFTNSNNILSNQRLHEENDISATQSLYGLRH